MPQIRIKPDTAKVIDELGGTLDSPDDVIREVLNEAGYGDRFEPDAGEVVIELYDKSRLEEEFTLEQGDSQIDVMVDVVEYLIQEYDLLNKVELPYTPTGDTKTLLNSEPVREDGEEMKRPQELSTGDYVNAMYSKDAKVAKLRQLARQCGLDLEPVGSWAE